MIYFILGEDAEKTKKAVEEINIRHRDDIKVSFDKEDFKHEIFLQEVLSESLFEKTPKIFFLYYLYETISDRNFLEEVLENSLRKTDSVVIFTKEKEVNLSLADKIFDCHESAQSPDFSLWRAIQNKDKKSAWLAYIKQKENEPVQLIQASLLSQFKKIYIAKCAESETYKELGFSTEKSYENSLSASKKYTKEDLEEYIYLLTKIQFESISGEDTSLSIEKILLDL